MAHRGSFQPAIARMILVATMTSVFIGALIVVPISATADAGTPSAQEAPAEPPPPTPTPTPLPPTPDPPTPTPVPPPPTNPPPTTIADQGETEQAAINSQDSAVETGDSTPMPEPTATPDLTPTPAPPTGEDLRLECTPRSVSAAVDTPVAVTCTVTGGDTLGVRQVTLSQVAITAPDGWVASGDGVTGGGALTLSPNVRIASGASESFAFELTPDGCDAPAGSASVTTALTHAESGAFPGPSAAVAAEVTIFAAEPPAVDAGPLRFGSATVSDAGYPVLSASASVTVSSTGKDECAATGGDWLIQVSTAGMYRAGTGEQIPADAMVYLGGSSSGAPSGVTPVAIDVPLGPEPVTIAHLGDANGNLGTWTVEFVLAPPSGVPPGEYSGSITYTVVRAP